MWRALLPGLLWILAACSSQQEPEDSGDYGFLTGTWSSPADSGFTLILSRVCCGARARLYGVLRGRQEDRPLESGSRLEDYTVIKPDSEAPLIHILEVHLQFGPSQEGAPCRMDGRVIDQSGNPELSGDLTTAAHKLMLDEWTWKESACVSDGEKREWVKSP